MPRSLMPCGQPKLQLDAVGTGVFHAREDRLPRVSVHGTISEHHQRALGPGALDARISSRLVCSGRSVISSMLLKPSMRRSGVSSAP
jgi:hypothetical protein